MAQSKANLDTILGSAWHVNQDAAHSALGHITGAGSPVSSVTPAFIGQEYYDTSGAIFYRAVNTTSADWTVIGDPGISAAELSFLDGATAGTAVASKAVVVDGSKNVAALGTIGSGAHTITSAATGALSVGLAGATNPAFQVDASTATQATGLKVTGAAAAAGVALAAISSGTDENLTIDAKGAGTVTINGTATGGIVLSRGVAISGTLTGSSASATALTVGRLGATTPAFQVDASTATSITGIKIKSAATGGGVAISAIGEASNGALTIDAQGSGTITLGGTSTGAIALSRATTITAGTLTLTAGTTAVAPATFLSGTNLTTAAAGAAEFDGVAFYLTSVASSRQVVLTEQFVNLTANGPTDNNSLLDSATAAAVFRTPTNGTITVAGSTSYAFEAIYKLSNTGTTSHTWSVLFGGAATFTSISYTALAYTGTTSGVTITALSALQIAVATAVPVTAASTSATEFVTVILRGIMRINAGGTLIPQMQASARPGATGTPAVIVLAGSYFRLWPVGSNTVASVGNWS